MKPIDIVLLAEEELEEALEYYEAQRVGLGGEFKAEYKAALEKIASNPLMYAIEVGKVRACPLKRFPYNVYFVDQPEIISIIAVSHHKRKLHYWRSTQSG